MKNEYNLEQALLDMFEDHVESIGGVLLDEWQSFEAAGVLTKDNGVVIRFENGEEFQLTIVRSK